MAVNVTDDVIRRRTQAIAYHAMQEGLLVNPHFCEICGSAHLAVYYNHHGDQLLDVRWLCRKCHANLVAPVHRKLGGVKGRPNHNLHKEARNAEIARLFDGGRGLTHREIAERLGMKVSAVSMVIKRWNDRLKKGEHNTDESSK